MPYYRCGNDDYFRKPKMEYESDFEPEYDDEEEDKKDCMKHEKKHCFCKVECPFKIIVKLVPGEEKKHRYPVE